MSNEDLLTAAAEAAALCEDLALENGALRSLLSQSLSLLAPCTSSLPPAARRAAHAAVAALGAKAAVGSVGDSGVVDALRRVPRALEVVLGGGGAEKDVLALMRGVEGVRKGGVLAGGVGKLKASGIKRAVEAVCGEEGEGEDEDCGIGEGVGKVVRMLAAIRIEKEGEGGIGEVKERLRVVEGVKAGLEKVVGELEAKVEDARIRCGVFERRVKDETDRAEEARVADELAAGLRRRIRELDDMLGVARKEVATLKESAKNVEAALKKMEVEREEAAEVEAVAVAGPEVAELVEEGKRLRKYLAASEMSVKCLRDALLKARLADIAVDEVEAKGVEGGLGEEGVWKVKNMAEREVRDCLWRTRRAAAMARVGDIGGRRKGLTANGADARMVIARVKSVV